MFKRIVPVVQQTRGMATLKEIQLRLKSIQNIAKITKSMKMIASTKVNKAQRTMENARVYGKASTALLEHTETANVELTKPVYVTVSSDRGLCGGIHSSLAKVTKKQLIEHPESTTAVLGMKARSKLQYDFSKQIAVSFDGVCKFTPSWYEAALVADTILTEKLTKEGSVIVYNSFKSVVAFETTLFPVPQLKTILDAPKLSAYELDEEVLADYHEFMFANSVYWALAEGYASEISARRSAMENATKNADEMIKKLTLVYNRSRQAVITNDLCDIITGASALE
ncbi:atp3 gamma subunit of the F1 sector of mitochondrial F1F0 ATP synthase [Boothiomyces sp. JEL0838]|nr:atp3 gamma subunit of the F1 sector of mitochondrial F1F0 ATP synthase [Boothiomyces sp. JEL0838]